MSCFHPQIEWANEVVLLPVAIPDVFFKYREIFIPICGEGGVDALSWEGGGGCAALGVREWVRCLGSEGVGALPWEGVGGCAALGVRGWVCCLGSEGVGVLPWEGVGGCAAFRTINFEQ